MSLQFGEFELDRERRQLLRSGRPVPLEPKAYELLSLLVERRPKALSRAQIRDVVWPGVFISESTLGVAVNAIRQALGDDARQPRFIRTVHGFGYAFCGEVPKDGDAEAGTTHREDRDHDEVKSDESSAGGLIVGLPARPAFMAAHRGIPLWGTLGALAAAAALVGWLLSSRALEDAPAPIKTAPLTTDGGAKGQPQLSPNSERVAYVWGGLSEDNWDIYVKAVGVGTKPLRLTEDPRDDNSPVWSPDGRQIAFTRRAEKGFLIFTVPSLGGQERRLIEVTAPPDAQSRLSWSPDGRWLAFSEDAADIGPARIVRLSLETMEKEWLTSPREGTLGDGDPAFSPDGTRLAFVRSGSGRSTIGDLDVWVQPVEGGNARRLTFKEYDSCGDLAWTPGGMEVLFSAGPLTEFSRVFRVRVTGGEPELVAGMGEWAAALSVRGTRATYVQVVRAPPARIWRVPGPSAARCDRAPEVLIESSGSDVNPDWSPDGRRIAFESTRDGQYNIWTCDSDGSHPLQLTNFKKQTGTPRWSPDGRTIAFDSLEAGDWNVYLIDADGRVARRLTPETSSDYRGVWSRDGRWIYFGSDRAGSSQIWKVPSAGGPADQVTRGGAMCAQVSWDDRHLYYARSEGHTSIWRVPVSGGEETEVVRGPIPHSLDWALSATSLVYTTEDRQARREEYTIHSLDLRTGETTELFRKTGPFSHQQLAVSADEEWILSSEADSDQSELRLIENFR